MYRAGNHPGLAVILLATTGCVWGAASQRDSQTGSGHAEVSPVTDLDRVRLAVAERELELADMAPDDDDRYHLILDQARDLVRLGDAAAVDCFERFVQLSACPEANDPYEASASFYKTSLATHDGGGVRSDESHYWLAYVAVARGENDVAIEHSGAVLDHGPTSPYYERAAIALGDLQFEAGRMGPAREAYTAALGGGETSQTAYARYRIAWIELNLDNPTGALIAFQFAAAQLAHARGDLVDLRASVLDDMLFAFAELEDGWARADAYYMSIDTPRRAVLRLEQLADLFYAQSREDDWRAVLTHLRHNHPTHLRAVQWGRVLLDELARRGNRSGLARAEDELEAFYSPAGEWGQAILGRPMLQVQAAALQAEIAASRARR